MVLSKELELRTIIQDGKYLANIVSVIQDNTSSFVGSSIVDISVSFEPLNIICKVFFFRFRKPRESTGELTNF